MISNRIFCSLSGIGIHYKQFLALVVILALLLGIAVVVVRPPTMQSGQTDNWWTISLNLLHGEGYSLCIHSYFPLCNSNNQTTASREPAPVFLFSIVALLAGESLTAAAVTELLIYLGILIAIFILTREWSNIYAALLSAFLWAFYVPALHLISQVSGDLLAGLSVTLGIAYFLRARRTQKNDGPVDLGDCPGSGGSFTLCCACAARCPGKRTCAGTLESFHTLAQYSAILGDRADRGEHDVPVAAA